MQKYFNDIYICVDVIELYLLKPSLLIASSVSYAAPISQSTMA